MGVKVTNLELHNCEEIVPTDFPARNKEAVEGMRM